MKSQKKSSEENIYLSSLLPSNILLELDSNHNLPKNDNENKPKVNKSFPNYLNQINGKSFFPNQINLNSINFFQITIMIAVLA